MKKWSQSVTIFSPLILSALILFALQARADFAEDCGRVLVEFSPAWSQHLWVVITDIYLNTKSVQKRRVFLGDLIHLHPPQSIVAKAKQVRLTNILLEEKEQILKSGVITIKDQKRLMPSLMPMKAVQENYNYILFEGSDRLEALRQAFPVNDGLYIEIEVYETKNQVKTLLDLHDLRRRSAPRLQEAL